MAIPFVDLRSEHAELKTELEGAIARVLESGTYILGQEVAAFEQEFANYLGSGQAVGVASGTDAVLLALKAFDIGPGDEVITVSHTAVATVVAIKLSGAQPILVDVDAQTWTMDPALVEDAITTRTRAIVPVHIYGHPADMDPILEIAKRRQLIVIEDCAQAHGALYKGQRAGTIGDAAAFSFYPTKNLGAIGDGGCVIAKEGRFADRLRELRQYGWRKRYVSEESGYNSRLDELQAAILRVKLRHLDAGNRARRQAAATYHEMMDQLPISLPIEKEGCYHVYHLYVIRAEERARLQAFLMQQEIASARHYPLPVHRQPAYRDLHHSPGGLAVTEQLAASVISLPMYPSITHDQCLHVAEAIASFYT